MEIAVLVLFLKYCLANECELHEPIGVYVRKNILSCAVVMGHFVLDETLIPNSKKIDKIFGNTTRIEGCIFMSGRTGLKNLHFLSRLEEVICDEEQASLVGYENVIHINNFDLDSFGLSSLKTVRGPGQIILSYDYDPTRSLPNSNPFIHCFTKQETIFLANHSQFNGMMFPTCGTNDSCFNLVPSRYFDEITREYLADEIPDHCTIFRGTLLFKDVVTAENFKNLKNLEMLIGDIKVDGSLLDDFELLPKLKMIYNYYGSNSGAQVIQLNNNPFLKNYSIPSLLPHRKLIFMYIPSNTIFSESPTFYGNPCDHMKQFSAENCEVIMDERKIPNNLDVLTRKGWNQFWTILTTSIGFFPLLRAILILLCMKEGKFLPFSRYIVALIMIILMLVEIERCIFYQKSVAISIPGYVHVNEIIYFPTLKNSALINPVLEFFSKTCVAIKHAALMLIPYCYMDYGIFFRVHNWTIKMFSRFLALIIFIVFIIISIYLYSRLFLFLFLARYETDELEVGKPFIYYLYMVSHIDGQGNASLLNPNKLLENVAGGAGLSENSFEGIEDVQAIMQDVLGLAFYMFSGVMDAVMAIVVTGFYFMKLVGIMRGKFCVVLLLLYLQLSINRIRWYISYDLFRKTFCVIPNTYLGQPCELEFGRYYGLIMTIIEKLPYFTFPIVSFYSWKFARYHLYLAHALALRNSPHFKSATATISKGSRSPFGFTSRPSY